MRLSPSAPAAPAPVPRWVQAVDLIALVAAITAVAVLCGWDLRLRLTDDIRLSVRSWWRPALLALLLLGIRHTLWREVPWHSRVAAWARALVAWPPLRAAFPVFLTSRLIVLAVGYVAVATIGIDGRAWRGLESDVFDLFARWDGGWYYGISGLGYPTSFNPARENAIAFFPGLPLLMRGVSWSLDINRWHAGILIVCAAFLWALTYVYRLAREDMDDDAARASMLFLAFYPFAVCFSAVLTEAPFLLAASAAFYHFRRDELGRAAAFALFTGLLRPNGFLLAGPLGLLALVPFAQSHGWIPGRPAVEDRRWGVLAGRLAVACVPLAGVAAYSAYIFSLYGDPFAWAKAQQAWGRGTAEIVELVEARWDMIQSQGLAAYMQSYVVEVFEAAAALFALALVWPVTRRFGVAYGVFVAMSVLPPLITMGPTSLGRYTAPLFPIFLWLGGRVRPAHRVYWIAGFAAGQAMVAALFYTWRAPY